jgi:hypothetical protein
MCQHRGQGRQAGQRSEDERDLLDLFLVVQLDAGRSPSRAIASGTRGGGRSDRFGLLWSGGHPLAGCSGVVGHRLPARAAAIRDRESTRHAYALPDCVPSASWSSSLPVPLFGPRGRKRIPRAVTRLRRVHRAGGATPLEVRTSPAVKTSSRRLSPRGARSAVGGIRAWAENPGRRASSCKTLLRLQALCEPEPKSLLGLEVAGARGSVCLGAASRVERSGTSADRRAGAGLRAPVLPAARPSQ